MYLVGDWPLLWRLLNRLPEVLPSIEAFLY